jgi:hypothetical protein
MSFKGIMEKSIQNNGGVDFTSTPPLLVWMSFQPASLTDRARWIDGLETNKIAHQDNRLSVQR